MEDSVFTKIIKGELPAYKVYEDDKTLAFMDIHPVQEGMVVVTTKTQVDSFLDLSEEDYTALWRTVKKVGKRLQEKFPSKKRIAIQVEGLDVPHVHVILFPFDTAAEFRSQADPDVETDYASLAELAKKLAF